MLLLAPLSVQAFNIERVSIAQRGQQAFGASRAPVASADGRFVAFASDADNLSNDDAVGWWGTDPDIFVHDRENGTIDLVSGGVSAGGMFSRTECRQPTISAGGRYVAFECFAGGFFAHHLNFHIYVHDRLSGTTTLVSRNTSGGGGNGSSVGASISADGRLIAFNSVASNLVSDDGNGVSDVFVYDQQSGTIRRVSVSDGGGGNGSSVQPAISADGRFVVFVSAADNLVIGDGNVTWDVFRHDLASGRTELVSVAPGGGSGNGSSVQPAISADGRLVAFRSTASDLVAGDDNGVADIFLRDLRSWTTERVVTGAGDGTLALSADGLKIAFDSENSGLVSGDGNFAGDVFLHDRRSGSTERVSVADDGSEGNGSSLQPAISADGRHVVFASAAGNLVSGDTNGVADIFVVSSDADTIPPEISLAATPGILWPPNKKYVDVLVDGLATDDSGSVIVEIFVTDEYGEMVGMFVPGLGSTVALESWRRGDDLEGRVYTFTAIATDGAGNRATATAEVVVPHDMREKKSR